MVDTDGLLTSGEVAQLFGVNPQTVARWAIRGLLGVIVTPGGHRRFRESEVNALLTAGTSATAVLPTGTAASRRIEMSVSGREHR